MLACLTTCCAEKSTDEGLQPAKRRYLHPRIAEVSARAAEEGAAFLILSGKYGLLQGGDPIPWYDHLLAAEEVDTLAPKVSQRLRELGITEVWFFTESLETDPLLTPYHALAKTACRLAGIPLSFKTHP